MKKVVFKNLVNVAGKHLRRGFFSNKVPGWNPVTSSNTDSSTCVFL